MQIKFNKIKNNPIYSVAILFIIATVVTLALSTANALTKDKIAEQALIAEQNARLKVFASAQTFEVYPKDEWPSENTGVDSVIKAFNDSNELQGLIIVSKARGYGGNVFTMSGITLEGKLVGFLVLSDNETPGLGKKVSLPNFTSKFIDKNPWLLFSLSQRDDTVNYIDAISGATISSRAMIDSANIAVSFAKTITEKLQNGGDK